MIAYWYDNEEGDQREPHHSGRLVDEAYLSTLCVFYRNFSAVNSVDDLAKERGYHHRDVITVSPDAMGDVYEEKVKMFFNEHLHEDEEIRWVMDGDGYFDVRSEGDEWVRVYVEKNDLIILPAGIYHRFTTDSKNYIKAMRLFKDSPKWIALNRGPETDKNEHRVKYLESIGVKPAVTAAS
ncbi:1,2-dihydroxy-3-keto-5-methylthiopentene dioxygenase [Arachnomyces sp. PD_36]|nr:1,2-dihydroxy-3-keto-5-methylthiopentene dioxygenase [Arachnomyces sp. PD_36]